MENNIFQEVRFLNDVGIINEASFIKDFFLKIKKFIVKFFSELIARIKNFINKLLYKTRESSRENTLEEFLKKPRSITISGGYSEENINRGLSELLHPMPAFMNIVDNYESDIIYYMGLVYRNIGSDYKNYDFTISYEDIIEKIYDLYPEYIDRDEVVKSICDKLSSTFILSNKGIRSYLKYSMNATIDKLKELCRRLKNLKDRSISNIDNMSKEINSKIESISANPNNDNINQIRENLENYQKVYNTIIAYSSGISRSMIHISANVSSLQNSIIELAKDNAFSNTRDFVLNLKEG